MLSTQGFSKKETLVLIETEQGNIKIKLYNETPLHRDNFIKLAKEGFYNDLLFHRVIKNFMIQGGDPDSKTADHNKVLGDGGPSYTIPAEIIPGLIHKKGALAAARMGDDVNPSRASSGSQFYIVHGKTFAESDLQKLEDRRFGMAKNAEINAFLKDPKNSAYAERVSKARAENNQQAFADALKEIEPIVLSQMEKLPNMKLTPEQKSIYTTIGGAPHLDGAYTVFGEVIEGLEVIDKIAAVSCDSHDRPTVNVKMKVSVINEWDNIQN